jgi:alpha/beta superfamily hydrolase
VTAPVSRLQNLVIPGPAGPLEGLLQERDDGVHALVALACHPHPLYGGTLHNKVVHRVAGVLHDLGAAVLRFNFRGVGKSAGTFGGGEGELEDARAALDVLRARHSGARSWVAGFSFGSWIAARLAAADPGVERLVLVAPPVRTQDFGVMRDLGTPTDVFQGTRDEVCPLEDLRAALPGWRGPVELHLVEGGGHFFDRQLADLGQSMRTALNAAARG